MGLPCPPKIHAPPVEDVEQGGQTLISIKKVLADKKSNSKGCKLSAEGQGTGTTLPNSDDKPVSKDRVMELKPPHPLQWNLTTEWTLARQPLT